MADSRPAALPPAQRTVGQLIAESIRLYGARFWTVLPLGVPFVVVDIVGIGHGVNVQTRLIRARSFGRAIVDEAARRNSEIIVVGADRRNIGGRTALFSDIVDFTLKHAPCRVMVAAAPPHAA